MGASMNETNEQTRIINRHKARLLGDLEDIGCPKIYLDAVISAYNWLRSDLQDAAKTESNTYETEQDDNRFNR